MNRTAYTARLAFAALGFTLMELVIVMTIIAILAAVALPVYTAHVKRAKEVTLKSDLSIMRSAIDKYTVDKEKAPQTLQDLVSAGYLRAVPVDPITRSDSTWQTEMETESSNPDAPPGIANVRSGADGTGTDGIAYNQY